MASITRGPKSPVGPSATETQILEATQRLLDQGVRFTEISVQRIIGEAGVARATFYSHFKDKTALITRLSGDLRERLMGMARDWDPGAGEDGADRYARFFVDMIATHRANGPLLAAMREVASYDTTVRGFYTEGLEGFDEAVLRTLVEQQRTGNTPADVDAVAASRVIVWGGAQAIARHIEVDDGDGDAAFARELGWIWWYGAYRRPSADQGR